MKKVTKLLFLSALACVSGALLLNSVPNAKEARAENTTYEVGHARTNFESHLNKGSSGNYDALYFDLDPAKASAAPFNSNWSLRYKPTTEDAVRLVRDGETYNLGGTAWETIVKLSETKCELQTWMFNAKLPSNLKPYAPQQNDLIVIGGSFTYTDGSSNVHTLVISETTFLCSFGREVDGKPESFFVALPQQIVDVDNSKVNISANHWWFLFDINGLTEDIAPKTVETGGNTDDRASYYPTSSDCFYLDGKPVGRATQRGLIRWDPNNYNWYVTTNPDGQGIYNDIAVGSVVVLDGIFTYYGNVLPLENFQRMGLQFHMLAFQKIGEGNGDYAVINLFNYLSDTIHSQFVVSDFIQSDQDAANTALDLFDENISLQTTTRACYELYDETVATLSALTLDENVLNGIKQQALQDINNYVDFDKYYETEQNTINGYISTYTTLINNATKRIDVLGYVNEFKSLVDDVSTIVDIVSEKVAKQEEGYEQYLESSDDVTLYDLGFDENITFHGREDERKNDINTYKQDDNIHNTFAPSANNPNGNVSFHFTYLPNATPTDGANVCVTLRGVAFAGYKFIIDTKVRSCYVERLNVGGDGQNIGGTKDGETLFVNGNSYQVTVGAIDLVGDIGKTWIYIKIDGVFKLSRVINSLLICTNPRVGLSPNDNAEAGKDYEGTATISLPSTPIQPIEGLYAGRLVYSQGNNEEIHATLDANSLPFNKEGLEVSYVARPESVQLIRGDATTNIGRIGVPVLKKINETDYIFDVKKCTDVQDGDIVYISGTFYYYSETDHAKTAFTISSSRFKYNASSNSWTPILTLEEAKADTSKKLEGCADLSKYDAAEQESINHLISEGKEEISKATSIEEVDAIYATYKAKIDAVKTTFRKYLDNAIAAVNAYKADHINDYRQDEKDEIASLKSEAIAAINAAKNNEEVDEIVANLKADIDDLLTDADYAAIELEDAIKEGQKEIYDHYSSIDTSKYSEAQISSLEKDTEDAIAAVKAAKSIAEVKRIVNEFKDSHQQLSPSKRGCKSSISTYGSLIAFVIAMSGLLIVLRQSYKFRKKED